MKASFSALFLFLENTQTQMNLEIMAPFSLLPHTAEGQHKNVSGAKVYVALVNTLYQH